MDSTICVSIGILMGENKDEIKLVPNTNPNNISCPIVIPKVCIKKMWKLKTTRLIGGE